MNDLFTFTGETRDSSHVGRSSKLKDDKIQHILLINYYINLLENV